MKTVDGGAGPKNYKLRGMKSIKVAGIFVFFYYCSLPSIFSKFTYSTCLCKHGKDESNSLPSNPRLVFNWFLLDVFFLQQLGVLSDLSVREVVANVIDKFGRIDVVNNVGVQCINPLAEMPFSLVEQTFIMNVYGIISILLFHEFRLMFLSNISSIADLLFL
ncbi:hypothetical protein L6452_42041 [Arctium lappa]|uniref:Uncharacterized protein n=1 Tax=Arctium lappa TaxID=4217 RepID=A0ACB8XHK7_ARCLA|nr:hypothetical protein L6452_42041 [Arctium lappa]